jgi:hypothetical protein
MSGNRIRFTPAPFWVSCPVLEVPMLAISSRTSIFLGAAAWSLPLSATASAAEETPPGDGDEALGVAPKAPLPAPTQEFQRPTIELWPGEEKTYCYYTCMPNSVINTSADPL